jgi:hypothetical protein
MKLQQDPPTIQRWSARRADVYLAGVNQFGMAYASR